MKRTIFTQYPKLILLSFFLVSTTTSCLVEILENPPNLNPDYDSIEYRYGDECEEGCQVCEKEGGYCVILEPGGLVCQNDDDCAGDLCVGGGCIVMTKACLETSDCEDDSQLCSTDGLCIPDDRCRANADCQAPETCSPEGYCALPKDPAECEVKACTNRLFQDSQCSSTAICSDGQCLESCELDSECETGVCQAGYCIACTPIER